MHEIRQKLVQEIESSLWICTHGCGDPPPPHPAVDCISSLSLSTGELSPKGLLLRRPAVSSGARSEERAEQLLHFWTDAGEASLLYVCTTQKQASKVFQTETAKCVKNISTLLLYCVLFERRGCFYRLVFCCFFTIPHMKVRIRRLFPNKVPSGLLSRSN